MCSFCSEHTKGSENIKEVSRPIPLNDEDGADLPELEDKKYNTDSASASSDEQSDNCDSGCSGSGCNNFDVRQLLSYKFQSIDNAGQCDDSCSVLVIMKDRNITAFF